MAADFTIATDMDAFLINPTIKMSREYVRRSADVFLPLELNDHLIRREAGKSSDHDSDYSSKAFIHDFSRNVVLPQEYASSEEEETTASPSDNDYYSAFGSTSSEGDVDSDSYSLEDLEIIDEDESFPQGLPLCAKAQPVYIISAGKAKVISVSSSSESSSIQSSPQSIPSDFESSFALFGSSKTHERSQQAASNYARTRSPERRPQPRPSPSRQGSSHLRRLNATPNSGPTVSKQSQTPLASQRAEVTPAKQDPFPTNWPLPPSPVSPNSPVIPPRRMPRLFTVPAKNPRRKISSASDSSTGSSEVAYQYNAPRSIPSIPSQPLFVDTSSRPPAYYEPRKQKLVPRGAGERAPTIMLPPCPNDGQWPLRPTMGPAMQQDSSALREFRRKSTLATAQF